MTGAEGSQRLPAAAHKPERLQIRSAKQQLLIPATFMAMQAYVPLMHCASLHPPSMLLQQDSRCSQLACSQTYKPTFGTSSVTCTAKSPARGGSGAPKRVLWGLTELVLSGQAAIMAIGQVRQLHALHASGTRLSEGTEPSLIWPRS